MAEDPSMAQWRADLEALKDATDVVRREHTSISENMASIDAKMNEVGDHWSSPAYGSFEGITTWFHTCQHDLEDLLADIVDRMSTSYQNYHNAEGANYDNLDGGPPHG
ncbi:hypothetical protein [Streptomyces sp. AcH 505]|uniref:hypothetical protein n=1 Tax=Streptomyces sp. AcH 505 TaxID=352211 RepID=UPI000AC37205